MDRQILTAVIVNVAVLQWTRAYGTRGWSQVPSEQMWKLAPTPVTWASQSQSFLISTWLFENGVTQIEGDRPYGRFWWDIFNREVYEKGWGFLCLLQLFNLCSTFFMSPLSSYKPFLFIKISAEKSVCISEHMLVLCTVTLASPANFQDWLNSSFHS